MFGYFFSDPTADFTPEEKNCYSEIENIFQQMFSESKNKSLCELLNSNSATTQVVDSFLKNMRSVGGYRGIHYAAECLPAAAFEEVIRKASPQGVNAALLIKDEANYTALHLAAQYQREEGTFKVLLDKASPEVINNGARIIPNNAVLKARQQVLGAKNFHLGYTPVHIAARFQPSSAFKKFLEIISPATLTAIAEKDEAAANEPLWRLAAVYQTDAAVLIVLLGKLKSRLSQVLVSRIFIYICLKRDTKFFYTFINNLNISLSIVQAICNDPDSVAQKDRFCCALAKHLCTVPNPALLRMLSPFYKDLYVSLFECYLLNLSNVTPFQFDVDMYRVLAEQVIVNDALISNDEFNFLTYCWKGVFKQPENPNDAVLKSRIRTKLSQGSNDYALYQHQRFLLSPSLTDLFNLGDAAIKIIREEHWSDIMHQLSDYTYRPKDLRHQHSGESKYVHLTNEIIEYKSSEDRPGRPHPIPKVHAAIKKNSATLISPQLFTPLFGEHDQERLLVGILLDIKSCIIKAMMTQDLGTYGRHWVGSEDEVYEYNSLIRHLIKTNLQDFKLAVRDETKQINEMLVKYPKEAIKAVVLVPNKPSNMPKAFHLAERYQTELLNQLGLRVPIIFYNPAMAMCYMMAEAPQAI